MGFGGELKGFAESFRSGWEIGAKARERSEKTRKPTDKELKEMPGIGEGIGTVDTTPGVDKGTTGSTDIAWNEADPTQKAFLNTLAGPESGGEYNIIYGGDHFDDYSKHPGKYVTIDKGPNKGKKSSAAGKYQFLESTWNDIASRYGLEDFSPANQDKAAWYLAAETYGRTQGRSLSADLNSKDPKVIANVGKALAPIWTSLPSGIEQGTSTDKFVSTFNKYLQTAPDETQTASTEGGDGVLPEPADQAQAKSFIDAATAAKMDPDIVKVTERAARDNPGLFAFNPKTKTLRTPEEQADMVKKGWSKTQKSKHLEGKAVDLVPINPETGQPDPDYAVGYDKISQAMRKAAEEEGVPDLKWGGDWKSFQDKPHWQVSMLEDQQQIEPGGLTTPEEEEQVRPTMFAASGGAIPEPVQAFADGGQPVDPYNRARALTVITPSANTSSFVPRRVGQPSPTRAAAATPAASSQGSYVERFRQMQADQAAARAAAAAKPAAVQPSYTDDQRIQANIAYANALKNRPSVYNVDEHQSGYLRQKQQAKKRAAEWDKTYGGEAGRTRFIDNYLTNTNKNKGATGAFGGFGGFADGGVVPEPEEYFANGGKVESRDEKFKRYQREASVGGRAGEGGQDARDRAAKRLSAEEGRPVSSAYSPIKDSKYFQPAKPRKGKSDGQVKPGLDTKPTSSAGKAKAAGTPTAGYEPKPLAKAAGTPTAGYEPKAKAAGTPTAGYDPKAKVLPEPEEKVKDWLDEGFHPIQSTIDWLRGSGEPEQQGPPYSPPSGVVRPDPAAVAPQVQPPMAAPERFAPEIATPQVAPPPLNAADAQARAREEWIRKSMGYAEGGIIPEEEERFQAPMSARAIDAGQTPPAARSAGGTPMTPQTAPAEPEPAEAVPSTAASAGAAREEQPKAQVRATPELLSDVSKALDGGIKFLSRTFGLNQEGAVPTPESGAMSQQGAQRFASGEGAATQEEINAIDDKIDPNRELDEGHRQMNRLAQTMQWYKSQGREDEAQVAAGSLMQYGAKRMSQLGSMASAAYKQYQQTGNREDLDNTIRFMEKAYQMVPDGASFDVSLDESTGQLVATHIDSEGDEETYNISPNEIPQYLKKAQDGSGYWGSVFRIADPEGAKVMERKKETEDERSYERSQTREERGYEERQKKEERTYEEEKAARDADIEERKAARKAKEDALESDRRAERDRLIREQEKLLAAAIAEGDPNKKKQFRWEDVAPYVQAADAAVDALKENKGDPELTAARDRALSRLQDALGGDAKKMEEYGYDPDFTYTREETKARKAKDGKWYIPDPDNPNGAIEVAPPTS